MLSLFPPDIACGCQNVHLHLCCFMLYQLRACVSPSNSLALQSKPSQAQNIIAWAMDSFLEGNNGLAYIPKA